MVSVSTSLMRFAFSAGARPLVPGSSVPSSKSGLLDAPSPIDSATERAQARLKEVKDRLAAMERMGFPADVVARLAATIGAEATRSAGQRGSEPSEALAAASGASAPAAADMEAVETDAEPDQASLPPAYRDVIQNRDDALASDDAAIRREFETLAARIRALQQRAEREAAAIQGR